MSLADLTPPPRDMTTVGDIAMSPLQIACANYAAAYCNKLQNCAQFAIQSTYGDVNFCNSRTMKACVLCDIACIEVRDVPQGPWRSYGDNNHFVIARRQTEQRLAQQAAEKTKK